MSAVLFRDWIKIGRRFHRSIQLVKDYDDGSSLQSYLLTKTTQDIATQILIGIQEKVGQRAWSITGPFGTGKSAFALFIVDLLTKHSHDDARAIRRSLGFRRYSFLPVLIVGQRSSFVPTYLAALATSLRSVSPSTSRKIRRTLTQKDIPNSDVITLTEEASRAAKQAGFGGLLIIVDEFGKFLEYVSSHPEETDLLIMQHLAETAARSDVPIVLITILHSAFAAYLHTTNQSQKVEWQKVQGRFRDIAFQEPPEQLLTLVGAAIEQKWPKSIQAAYKASIKKIISSSALEETKRRLPVGDLVEKCAPLHPITALLLWPVFRSKLAQNERSLFAFLSAVEPFGFQEFLSLASSDGLPLPFYRVDQFYDYVTSTLGAAIYLGDRAHRWAEIDNALNRIPHGASDTASALVKTVGLLNLYGAAVGLRTSKDTLQLALDDKADIAETLELLERASILVYRKHQNAFGLWEGSDIDLDECAEEARLKTGDGSIARRLEKMVHLRPVVARAHYIRTGTLRYLRTTIIDGSSESISQAIEQPVTPADGELVFVLTPKKQERRALIAETKEHTGERPPTSATRIFAFPNPITGLEEALAEVEVWTWVKENVTALQGDPVARKELQMRLLDANANLERIAGQVLGLQGAHFDPQASDWIYQGEIYQPRSPREFLQWLSRICDVEFAQAPILQNELINRDRLSSASAKARRNLLEAMLVHENDPELGLLGTPPEVSIYKSMLFSGGFHRARNGDLRFGAPKEHWLPVWQATEDFLESTVTGRRSLKELYTILTKSPFGLRQGPLPLFVCAVLLAHPDDLALYEENIFVPELRIEVLERLVRVPEKFELQRYKLTESDRRALTAAQGVISLIGSENIGVRNSQLLQVIKPLVVFAARLPAYVKRTKRLEPPEALLVRDLLLKARDPHVLLFSELPQALNVSKQSSGWHLLFADRLHDSLRALQLAYPQLLDNIESQIRDEFDLQGTADEVRYQIQKRAAPLVAHATERTLSLFLREVSRFDNRDWREIIARVVNGGQPPSQWHDNDVVHFQIRLRQVVSDFLRLEELVSEKRQTSAPQILRIGLLDGAVYESREVIALTPDRAPKVFDLANEVSKVLENYGDQTEEFRKIRVAALAQVASQYLPQNGKVKDE